MFLEVLFTSIKFILNMFNTIITIILQFMAIMEEVGHRRFQLLPGSSLVRARPAHQVNLAVSLNSSRLAVSLGSQGNLCHPLL